MNNLLGELELNKLHKEIETLMDKDITKAKEYLVKAKSLSTSVAGNFKNKLDEVEKQLTVKEEAMSKQVSVWADQGIALFHAGKIKEAEKCFNDAFAVFKNTTHGKLAELKTLLKK